MSVSAAGFPSHRVLVVDDSDDVRMLVRIVLESSGAEVREASNGREGLREFYAWRPDLVVLDVGMPELDGWQTLEMIRQVSSVPVIMLTAQSDGEVRGLRAGADDYLGKPFRKEEFQARIDAVLRRSAIARRDDLTGLPNRRAFDEHLDGLLLRAPGHEFALAIFDLDNFKQINDTQGHPAGDRVLQEVARVAWRQVRLDEELFRIGGEEFAIVILGDRQAALIAAERVRAAVAAQQRGHGLPTLSAGVAAFPADALTKEGLVQRADEALYAAKRSGKNTVVTAAPATLT
jgi:two-component system cell cycle response regulator